MGGKDITQQSRATTLWWWDRSINRAKRDRTWGVSSLFRLYGRRGHFARGHTVWETCVTNRSVCHACPPSLLQITLFRSVPGARRHSPCPSRPRSFFWNESRNSNGDNQVLSSFQSRSLGLILPFGDGIAQQAGATRTALSELLDRSDGHTNGGLGRGEAT